MTCKQCEALLGQYEKNVQRYGQVARALTGMIGDEFHAAYEAAENLRQLCAEANRQLMDHWRHEHRPGERSDATSTD
jgi:hypothetical protein